jgi:hypothetical protein
MPEDERETSRSPSIKMKSAKNTNDKKTEAEPTMPTVQPFSATSVPMQGKMSEPLSLLSSLSANPMSVSSIMKTDLPTNYMPPNFNSAFPTPQQFLPSNHPFPPGFPLQPRLPMPPPPGVSQPQSASISDSHRSSLSTNISDTDSLDHSSSPSQMDTSTNTESGISTRQAVPSTITQKPSALSSLLEFGILPPSNLGDIRPTTAPTNPFPFPFVSPGPGVPFSPQSAAGMTTYYRPQFGVPSVTTPLDVTQQSSSPSKPAAKSKKKAAAKISSNEVISQNILDEPSPPKKKARKSNSRGKGKTKKNATDGENGIDEDNISPPPTNRKKKKTTKDTKDDTSINDTDETKVTNGNTNNNSHNLLAQMGLMNNSFMPPPSLPLQSSSSTNGTTPAPNAQQQQAQIAAMYNMTPHFGAYNTFPGAFNPAFAANAYPGGYPAPYGFHPAFGTSPTGQPFPFMPPTPSSITSSMTKYVVFLFYSCKHYSLF